MKLGNNSFFLGQPFPIGPLIAIVIGMTFHINSVNNKDVLNNPRVARTEKLTPHDLNHLIVFVNPKNNFKTYDFFQAEKWNSYFHSDRIAYNSPVIQAPVILKNIKFESLNNKILGTKDVYADCIINKIIPEVQYSVNCLFSKTPNEQNSLYRYEYDYTFNKNLSVNIKNIFYTYPKEDLNFIAAINDKTWGMLFFWSIIIQYYLIPGFYKKRYKIKAIWDKLNNKENYENLPPIKISGRNIR